MTARTARVLFWMPRLIGLWFVLFVSMFVFDMPSDDSDWSTMLAGAAMHLVVAVACLGLLVVAWRREIAGGVLFVVAGGTWTLFWGQFLLMHYLVVGALPVLIGVLFLADSLVRSRQA